MNYYNLFQSIYFEASFALFMGIQRSPSWVKDSMRRRFIEKFQSQERKLNLHRRLARS